MCGAGADAAGLCPGNSPVPQTWTEAPEDVSCLLGAHFPCLCRLLAEQSIMQQQEKPCRVLGDEDGAPPKTQSSPGPQRTAGSWQSWPQMFSTCWFCPCLKKEPGTSQVSVTPPSPATEDPVWLLNHVKYTLKNDFYSILMGTQKHPQPLLKPFLRAAIW